MPLSHPPEISVSAILETTFEESGLYLTQSIDASVSWELSHGLTTIKKQMQFQGITSCAALRAAWLPKMRNWLSNTRQSLNSSILSTKKVIIKIERTNLPMCEISLVSAVDGLKSLKVGLEGISDLNAAREVAREVLSEIVDYALENLDSAWPV